VSAANASPSRTDRALAVTNFFGRDTHGFTQIKRLKINRRLTQPPPHKNHASSLAISPCQGHSSERVTSPARTGFCRTYSHFSHRSRCDESDDRKSPVANAAARPELLSITRPLHHSNPLLQRKIQVPANKKMNVIGHDNVAANADSTQLAFLGEANQLVLHRRIRQQFPAPMGVERDKVQWGIISLKDAMQPRWSVGHGQRSIRCLRTRRAGKPSSRREGGEAQ